jgi:threonine dehydrogenase-like Zn-dependent dehydrogenase
MKRQDKMKAVGVDPRARKIGIVQHPAPGTLRADEVKIRTLEVGVCGTDKEICSFAYGSPPVGADYLILGHECLGEVVETGPNIKSLKPGDLVVPTVRRPCSHRYCQPCRVGRQDFCATNDFTERGIKLRHGFMTEFYVEEEKFLSPVPSKLRDIGVLVEPLTVAEKAFDQLLHIQTRLPWECPIIEGKKPWHCHRAVVLGAGPIGILGAMKLIANGFETFVYSRSPAPNAKSRLVESFGAKYISSQETPVDRLVEKIGDINLVYEAVGASEIAFDLLRALGMNGIFIFTGIPAPEGTINLPANLLMRNLVLKNQVILGTVNADRGAFEAAIKDLARFKKLWPEAVQSLITGRYKLEAFQDVVSGKIPGIKNVIALD